MPSVDMFMAMGGGGGGEAASWNLVSVYRPCVQLAINNNVWMLSVLLLTTPDVLNNKIHALFDRDEPGLTPLFCVGMFVLSMLIGWASRVDCSQSGPSCHRAGLCYL